MIACAEGASVTACPSSTRLVARQRARLVRLCATVVGDASAAEDLAQEALLTAWRLQHRLTDPTGADAWLNAIARNVCRRWLRARGAVPVPPPTWTVPTRSGLSTRARTRGARRAPRPGARAAAGGDP